MTIHEQYHVLAEQSLNKGKVDAEAYIVKVLSEMAMSKEQVASVQTSHKPISDTKNENRLNSTNDYLKAYLRTNNKSDLIAYLKNEEQILTEVLHNILDADEKQEFILFIDRLQKIKNTVKI